MARACAKRGTVLTVLLLGLVTGGTFARADETKDAQAQRNGGYYLLHKVCTDEQNVHLLLIVKDSTPDIADFVKRVSAEAYKSVDEMEDFHERDPRLKFDPDPLPQIELDVRASIKDQKQHQLLFGTTGAAFRRALLVSQIEASNYASNLAKVIGEQEINPNRARVLARMSERWAKLREEAYRLLAD